MDSDSSPPERHANVLIVFGSRHGGTAGIAAVLADRLYELGADADAVPADVAWRHPAPVDGYDAVVVGSALYARRWRPDVIRFLRLHASALAEHPLWLFHSGPCGPDAARDAAAGVPEPAAVRRLRRRIPAEPTVTFGGVLDPSTARGFIARRMARSDLAGDYRDPERIRAWGDHIAGTLPSLRPRQARPATGSAQAATPR